jgi:hypothetical protein
MATRYIDYRALKAAVRMTDVLRWLNIDTYPDGNALRAECPICQRGGDRALFMTPSKHLFACHGVCIPDEGKERYGGDTIKLVAAVHGCSEREAAAMIADQFGFAKGNGNSEQSTSSPSTVTVPITKAKPEPATDGLQPLAHLSTDHPAIEALGLSAGACTAIGMGYAGKGLMRGRVAFPLRLPDGTLVGYMGLATASDMTPLLLFPKNLDERCATAPKVEEKPKQSADDMRKLFRVVA